MHVVTRLPVRRPYRVPFVPHANSPTQHVSFRAPHMGKEFTNESATTVRSGGDGAGSRLWWRPRWTRRAAAGSDPGVPRGRRYLHGCVWSDECRDETPRALRYDRIARGSGG